MTLPDPLRSSIVLGQALLDDAGVTGALIGGVAVAFWGEPRFTKDADYLVDLGADQVDGLLASATALGLKWDPEEVELLGEGGFMRLQPHGVEEQLATPVDILLADSEYLRQAMGRTRTAEILGSPVRVIAVEDLFLLKLIAFRPQDTLDLDTLWDTCAGEMDMDYLTHWAEVLGVDRKLSVFTDP